MSRCKSVYLLRLPAGLFLLAMCVLMTGCAVYDTITEEDLSEEYRVVLSRWTSEAKVYKDFASILQASATFKSVPFRRAYVRKYARDYQLTPAEANEMLKQQLEMARHHLEFVVSVSGSTKQEYDLSTGDTPWRVFLEGLPGERLKPFEIRPVKKKTAKLEGFYPYISPWARVYHIRFTAPAEMPRAGDLNLVVTGVLGAARLVYPLGE